MGATRHGRRSCFPLGFGAAGSSGDEPNLSARPRGPNRSPSGSPQCSAASQLGRCGCFQDRADLFLLACGFWPLFYCGVKKKKRKEKKQTKKGVMQKSAWHGLSLGHFPDLAQLGSSARVSWRGWRGRVGGEGAVGKGRGCPVPPPSAAGSVCLQRAGVHDLHQPADRGALAAGQPGFRQGAR